MKKLFVLFLILSFNLQAKIIGSSYEADHQNLIEKALYTQCGYHPNDVTQIASKVNVVRIDQGVIDTYYTTDLEVKIHIDQRAFDVYNVRVESMSIYSFYQILSVKCQ
jgi:hypothetical protein